MKKINQIKKKFSKLSWYKQAAAVMPFYIGYPWLTCLRFSLMGRDESLNYRPIAVYLKDDYFDVFFSIKKMRQLSDYYYSQELKKPGSTLGNFI